MADASVGALEAGGDVLAAVVEDEAEGDRQGEVDSQTVEVQRGAQAGTAPPPGPRALRSPCSTAAPAGSPESR